MLPRALFCLSLISGLCFNGSSADARGYFTIGSYREILAKNSSNFPGQITLANDSPFILTASVFTHSGDYLGQVILQPGQQKNFVTSLGATTLSRPGYPEVSITPYRVIWQCPGGGFYSMCTDGAVGSYVRANACDGVRFCAPKDRQKPKSEAAPSSKKPVSKK